ncbi:hypothetical protein K461DRAFT_254809 [Myriangium duriaei CBS 260.36]|uniref:Rhodopsin domain-containing protein n=1 Tax=Myriangium duriaei CBS 260.36 TaxID=1168546 RepID=A0A9P4MK85_9PEZI|nr:hypothetical protein K461DRAFT_254809 [Myriangium duriaei CBS 260.36]
MHGIPNPRGDAGRAWVLTLFALSTLVYWARMLTRIFIIKAPGWDDAAATIAWLFNIGLVVAECLEVHFGVGLHMAQIPLPQLQDLLKAFWTSILCYNLTLFFTKVAVIAQYLRFFTQPTFRKVTYAVLAFTVTVSLYAVITSIILCIPVQSFWDFSVKQKFCMPHAVSWYSIAALNVLNDIMIIILPMPILKGLNMPFRQRIALMLVFALGSFVCLISFIRIKQLHDVSFSPDISYFNVSASTWSAVECSVAIICASLPALKATATRYFPRLFNSIHGSNRRPSSSDHADRPSAHRNWGRKNGFGFSSRSSERTKISAVRSAEAEGPYSELRQLNSSGQHIDEERQSPSDGQIGVTTVMNQRVEHLNPRDRGYPAANNLYHAGNNGSENVLFPPTDLEKAQGDKHHNFTYYRP